jgi:uncharacterized membrane protein YheB (UPF0754 family)
VNLQALLPWVLPPALGAVIGYVTNAVAIRMLFRPHRAIRLFGIRLPFTPGVIPRQREALAESIGRMVSEHLITRDTVLDHIQATDFQDSLRSNVAIATAEILERRPGELERPAAGLFDASLHKLLSGLLYRFLRSRAFLAAVRSLIDTLVRELGRRELQTLVNPHNLIRFLGDRVLPVMLGDRGRVRLRQALAGWIARHREVGTMIGDLIPENVGTLLVEGLKTSWPAIREAFVNWLRSDSVRREMEVRGRFLVRDVLDKMNVFQRIFVSVAQYDRTLNDKMPEIVSDALDAIEGMLRDETFTERLFEGAARGLQKFRGQTVDEMARTLNIDLEKRTAVMVDRIWAALDAESLATRVGATLDRWMQRNGDRPVREIVGSAVGVQESDIVEYLTVKLLDYLTSEEAAELITDQVLGGILSSLSNDRSDPLAVVLGIGKEQKETLDSFLVERLQRLLARRLPDFVEGFDVRRMVVEKINNLDVAQVESLLMMVIARHLKWINVFGALLGSLIGASQVLINRVL